MKNTIDEVIKCINTKVSFAGGGVIGAFFISIFYYLLGKMGSIIVISVLMLIGVILVSDLSISDAISKIREKLKRKKEYVLQIIYSIGNVVYFSSGICAVEEHRH